MFSSNDAAKDQGPKRIQQKEEILALWSRVDRNGDTYYTGKLADGTCVLAFYNKDKSANIPALRVFKTDRKKFA